MLSGKGRERIFSFEVKYFAFLKNIDTFFFFLDELPSVTAE